MTNPADPESITLRALDRLPPGEVAEAEASIAEDPDRGRQLREVEDIAAHLWHASSPLHSAPPEIWDHIKKEIQPAPRAATSKPTRTVFLALGWAAALVLLLVLLFRDAPANSGSERPLGTDDAPAGREGRPPFRERSGPRPSKSPAPERSRSPEERRLRKQLDHLRARLAMIQEGSSLIGSRPTIVPLHAPGSEALPPPADTNAHLVSLITKALSDDLQRRQELETDLVIERGWEPDLFLEAPDEFLIRHRNFLTAAAEELQFLVSADGDYYDPASKFVWSPAEDGGGYLGQRAGVDLDLALFSPQTPPDDSNPDRGRGVNPESSEVLLAQNAPTPRGYLIEDPGAEGATLIVDELPPQPPGVQLVGEFYNANGSSQAFLLSDRITTGALSAGSEGVIAVQLPPEAKLSSTTQFDFSTVQADGTTQVILSNRTTP